MSKHAVAAARGLENVPMSVLLAVVAAVVLAVVALVLAVVAVVLAVDVAARAALLVIAARRKDVERSMSSLPERLCMKVSHFRLFRINRFCPTNIITMCTGECTVMNIY
jgi:hypothetical protein